MPEEISSDPRAERSRRAIIEVVMQLLQSEGLDSVTHVRVASVAQVGRATVYRHWPTVAGLVHAALSAEIELAHSIPVGDLAADLVAELRLFRDLLDDRSKRAVIVALIERSQHDPDFVPLLRDLNAAGTSVLRQILAGARNARGRRLDAAATELAIAGLLGPIFYRGIMVGVRMTNTELSRVVDRFLAELAT